MMKKLILPLMALLMTATAQAQTTTSDEVAPYGFVGLQGGVNRTWSNPGSRDWKPIFGLQGGYFFTEVFGARLQGTYSSWTKELAGGKDYDAKRLGLDMDVLFNFSNLVFPGRQNLVNVIGVAGMPFEVAVPHTRLDIPATADNGSHAIWKTGWRGGGIIQLNLSRHFAIDLEAGTSYIAKRSSDEVLKNRWWPYAMAGVTYKFGFKKQKKTQPVVQAPAEPAVVEQPKPQPKPEVKPEPKPQPKPEPKPEPAKIGKNIFFDLAKSDIRAEQEQNLDDIARFAKEHPATKLSLVGYADAQTGNARINRQLSQQRANAVKKALVKRGVEADRIATDWKGDTVQPFSNNDDNRVVIVVGEE